MAAPNQPEYVSAPVAELEPTIDLRHYWRLLLRRRWIVVTAFATVVAATVAWTVRQPRIYAASCSIIIEAAAPRVLDSQQVQEVMEQGAGSSWVGRDYYETQFRIITSRAVAARVVDRLGLAGNAKFLRLDDVKNEAERERFRQSADAIALAQSRLRLEPVKDSRVVRLVVEDRDPELAAQMANAFAEAYIAEMLAVRSSTNRSASSWLEQQLADLEVKLEESGKRLFEFKKQRDILSTSWEDRQGMVTQRLQAVNDALSKAKVQRAQLEARSETIQQLLRAVKAGDENLDGLPVIESGGAIQGLKSRYYELHSECANLRAKYLEGHPSLVACEGKLAAARADLHQEVRTALRAAQREYEEVRLTERNLTALLAETKADAFGFNQYERDYLELKRAYENNQRLYEMVLKRIKDAGLSGALDMSNVRILDRARPSLSPVRPRVAQNLLAAIVLGLMLGVALAIGVEFLDNTVRSQEQVEQLGVTFLGVIPRVKPSDNGRTDDLVVLHQPKSVVAECCRAIRTNLLFMSPDKPLRSILVTSAGPQDGKTTTAIDLAVAMAESGSRVLLVDADMRRPRVHKALGLAEEGGLSSLILGEGQLEQAVRRTELPNLHALTCGPIPPNPAELLHTEAFTALLERMLEGYDRVVIDSPPVAAVSDAVVLSTLVNGTVLVVKAGRTTRDAARRAVRALGDVKARVLGAVLNDLDTDDQRYGGYYAYGYYYGDKKEEAA